MQMAKDQFIKSISSNRISHQSACICEICRQKMSSIRSILIVTFVVAQTAGIALAKPATVIDIARAFPDGGGYE
jgi:hypothetical protein